MQSSWKSRPNENPMNSLLGTSIIMEISSRLFRISTCISVPLHVRSILNHQAVFLLGQAPLLVIETAALVTDTVQNQVNVLPRSILFLSMILCLSWVPWKVMLLLAIRIPCSLIVFQCINNWSGASTSCSLEQDNPFPFPAFHSIVLSQCDGC